MRSFLTFDDVGLIPKFNRFTSRLNTNVTTKLCSDEYMSPFIPSNMDSVISSRLAETCRKRNAPIIFHRFTSIDQKLSWIKEFPEAYMSIGVHESFDDIHAFYEAGCRRFCIDIAHGHSQAVIDMIVKVKELNSKNQIIAGNVCTYQGVISLAEAGADIIKVGVGPGSACITRMMTGFGVPQFSAIQECYRAKMNLQLNKKLSKSIYLIADGGIKHPRDAVLALAVGADAVMMGSIFARTFESASLKKEIDGKIYGRYRGQASSEFMNEYFGDTKKRQAEGVAFDIEVTKSANDVFDEYEGGLRSALTYCGTNNLTDFRINAELFESTSNYIIESNYRASRY